METLLRNFHDSLMEVLSDKLDKSMKIVAAIHLTVRYVPQLGTPEQQVKAAKAALEALKDKQDMLSLIDDYKARHFHNHHHDYAQTFVDLATNMVNLHHELVVEGINTLFIPLNKLLVENNAVLEA